MRIGSDLFLVGGQTEQDDACQRFNIATNEWSTINPMPTMRYHLGVAGDSSRVFAVGGVAQEADTSGAVEVRRAHLFDSFAP